MRVLESMTQLADLFGELTVAAPLAVSTGKNAAARFVKAKVDEIYGDESKLAPISQDSTAQLRGDGGAGGPLYEDGSLLKDSVRIEHPDLETAIVGSDELIHVYHEFGYVTSPNSMIPNKIVPGRPVFHVAAAESEAGVAAMIGESLEAIFAGIIKG